MDSHTWLQHNLKGSVQNERLLVRLFKKPVKSAIDGIKIQKIFHSSKPSLSTQHSVFHFLFNIKLPHARISPSHDSPPYPQRNTQETGNSVSGHVPESVVGNRLTPTK